MRELRQGVSSGSNPLALPALRFEAPLLRIMVF